MPLNLQPRNAYATLDLPLKWKTTCKKRQLLSVTAGYFHSLASMAVPRIIENLGSSNGTFVNEVWLKTSC
jgi:hypothetical protein